ncbi:MAG: YqeG family HAD IIIA-type phosphatase, partial [Cyanobacteria bacterium J06629_9]
MPNWIRLLQPDLYLGNSVLALTPDILHQHGIRGLILDVDETLVSMSSADPDADIRQWVQRMKASQTVVLLSNNIYHERIRRIAEALDVPFFTAAGKPSRRKLRQALAAIDLPVETVAMVGDRLFTDVLAGNRLGLFTVLVDPVIELRSMNPKKLLRGLEIWISARLGVTLKA